MFSPCLPVIEMHSFNTLKERLVVVVVAVVVLVRVKALLSASELPFISPSS